MHTTNYYNTFIAVADDCPAESAEVPPMKGDNLTVANLHFDLVAHQPYEFTSDDVVFHAYATKNGLNNQLAQAREQFFSKGQPCMRCSPLGKRYGWGVHSNEDGKIAIYPVESAEYQRLKQDGQLKQLKAMRTKR